MRTVKDNIHGTMIRLADIKVGDVIMVHRHINSKSNPYWPYRITESKPADNANGYSCMPGRFLLPGGDSEPGKYSATARVRMHDGELYVVGKPMPKSWAKNELKKAVTYREELQQKIDWLEGLDS